MQHSTLYTPEHTTQRQAHQYRRTTTLTDAVQAGEESYAGGKATGIHFGGRVVLNLWRVMRSEVKLQSFTLAAFVYAVLGQRLPAHPPAVLQKWWQTPALQAIGTTHTHIHTRTDIHIQTYKTIRVSQIPYSAVAHVPAPAGAAQHAREARRGAAHGGVGARVRHRLLLRALQGLTVPVRSPLLRAMLRVRPLTPASALRAWCCASRSR